MARMNNLNVVSNHKNFHREDKTNQQSNSKVQILRESQSRVEKREFFSVY